MLGLRDGMKGKSVIEFTLPFAGSLESLFAVVAGGAPRVNPPNGGAAVVVVLVGAVVSFDASLASPPKRFGTAMGSVVRFQGKEEMEREARPLSE